MSNLTAQSSVPASPNIEYHEDPQQLGLRVFPVIDGGGAEKPFFASVRDTEIKGSAKAVFYSLGTRADAEGLCWPSLPTIAKDSGLSLATVKRCLPKLEAQGFIDVVQRGGGSAANVYRVNVSAPLGRLKVSRGSAQGEPGVGSSCTGGRLKVSPEEQLEEQSKEQIEEKEKPSSGGGARPRVKASRTKASLSRQSKLTESGKAAKRIIEGVRKEVFPQKFVSADFWDWNALGEAVEQIGGEAVERQASAWLTLDKAAGGQTTLSEFMASIRKNHYGEGARVPVRGPVDARQTAVDRLNERNARMLREAEESDRLAAEGLTL